MLRNRTLLTRCGVYIMLRRFVAVGLLVVGALYAGGGVGCASPTLPLPPPLLPTVESGLDANHVKLLASCGNVEPHALVVIVNQNTTVPKDVAVSGALADDCGGWDSTVYAHSGDFLSITQEFGTVRSSGVLARVP